MQSCQIQEISVSDANAGFITGPCQDYYNNLIYQKFKQLLQRGKSPEDHLVSPNDTLDYRLSVMQLATQYIAYLNLEFSEGLAFETGF